MSRQNRNRSILSSTNSDREAKMPHMRMFLQSILLTVVLVTPIAFDSLYAAGGSASADQSEPRKVSWASTTTLKVAPAALQPASLDKAIDRFLNSAPYKDAESAVNRGSAQKIDLSISIMPGQTASDSCVCGGGKGTINGKPVIFDCWCSPAGCGSCGGSYRSN